jgi:hypothetical protein
MADDIKMYLGNELDIDYTINDEDGAAVDLGVVLLTFSVRTVTGATSYTFQRQNTSAGGGDTEIEETDYSSGTFSVHIVAANTSSLTAGKFVFDLEVEMATGETYTADLGTLVLMNPITSP